MKRFLILLGAAVVAGANPAPAMAWQDAATPPGDMTTTPPAAATDDDAPLDLAELLGGGRLQGPRLEAAIARASSHPLGSKDNPVRVSMPAGQYAYLRRLRCSDDRPPTFERVGNFGAGVFGSIIDGYRLSCSGDAQPRESLIYMDMYHPDHVETAAPPGFIFKPRARQP